MDPADRAIQGLLAAEDSGTGLAQHGQAKD